MIDFVLRKSCDRPSAGLCTRARRRTLFRIEQAWHLTDLDYADNVILLESGSERSQQVLYALQGAGEEVGLAISKFKTKTLEFGETEPVINLDGEIVEAVNHFRYLGSEVMSSGRLNEELRTRIVRASATFGQLFKIWRSKIVGGAVTSWLVSSPPERAVRVRALAGDIVLCSWTRHFTLTVPLSSQV